MHHLFFAILPFFKRLFILLDFSETENKHLSSIWQLKWTDRDRTNSGSDEGEMEVLMSISTDGRVTQWMIRKGFESMGTCKIKFEHLQVKSYSNFYVFRLLKT